MHYVGGSIAVSLTWCISGTASRISALLLERPFSLMGDTEMDEQRRVKNLLVLSGCVFWAGPCKAGIECLLGRGACRCMSISRKAPNVEHRYGPLAEAYPRLSRAIEAAWTNFRAFRAFDANQL